MAGWGKTHRLATLLAQYVIVCSDFMSSVSLIKDTFSCAFSHWKLQVYRSFNVAGNGYMSVNSMDPQDEGMVKLGFRTPLLVHGFNVGQHVPPHVRISHQCGKTRQRNGKIRI